MVSKQKASQLTGKASIEVGRMVLRKYKDICHNINASLYSWHRSFLSAQNTAQLRAVSLGQNRIVVFLR
jgi:hypothetical protein